MSVGHVILDQLIMAKIVNVILDFMETEIDVYHVIVPAINVTGQMQTNVYNVSISHSVWPMGFVQDKHHAALAFL